MTKPMSMSNSNKNFRIKKHTCINKAPKAAQDASSLMEPTENFKAAQSTNANPNPNTVDPFSSKWPSYVQNKRT